MLGAVSRVLSGLRSAWSESHSERCESVESTPEALSVLKDSYLVELLDLQPGHLEADLHQGLLQQLKNFLIELGRDFCFVASEFSLQVGGRNCSTRRCCRPSRTSCMRSMWRTIRQRA